MNKKILHLNFSDNGGAANAVIRIHESLKRVDYDSKILVAEKTTNLKDVICDQNFLHKFIWDQKKKISRNLKYFFKSNNKNTHSINFFNSNIISQIKEINPDVINIHWIGNEFISLKQISKIKKPIIWTLHDMWLYCGAEHYTSDKRFVDGYKKTNRDMSETGLDINQWVWRRKKKYLDKNIKIISTTSWQKENSQKSFLLKENPTFKIPYPIDTNFWKPLNSADARSELGWDNDKIYFLFGFSDYFRREIKGLDIALNIFEKFKKKYSQKCILNIFGDMNKDILKNKNINILGNIDNPNMLKLLYSASNLLLNPSRLESFGQIALESLACGTPILINKNTGTNDLIMSKEMGFVLNNEKELDLESLITWFNQNCLTNNKKLIHKKIKENFSMEKVGQEYLKLIKDIFKEA